MTTERGATGGAEPQPGLVVLLLFLLKPSSKQQTAPQPLHFRQHSSSHQSSHHSVTIPGQQRSRSRPGASTVKESLLVFIIVESILLFICSELQLSSLFCKYEP
ncbi:hypothetical protein WMY93_012583 [Mugilogobius chulae]|uniref:Uncharacterized protein n=1 Tax=Mugilogobius chulae TaxID=88201 RepID=A0AAW0P1M8_9GOBI